MVCTFFLGCEIGLVHVELPLEGKIPTSKYKMSVANGFIITIWAPMDWDLRRLDVSWQVRLLCHLVISEICHDHWLINFAPSLIKTDSFFSCVAKEESVKPEKCGFLLHGWHLFWCLNHRCHCCCPLNLFQNTFCHFGICDSNFFANPCYQTTILKKLLLKIHLEQRAGNLLLQQPSWYWYLSGHTVSYQKVSLTSSPPISAYNTLSERYIPRYIYFVNPLPSPPQKTIKSSAQNEFSLFCDPACVHPVLSSHLLRKLFAKRIN